MRIPLFDIDKTLITGDNKAHRDAFSYAIETVFHIDNASIDEINADGKIDTQILVEILAIHNVPESQAIEKMPQAIRAMETYYEHHHGESTLYVLKGVRSILSDLNEQHIPCGLLTGNVESIGWHKMEKLGLKEYFSFGGFGNLAYKRVDLIAVAQARVEKILGHSVPLTDLFIVGDTPLDIACAKAGGILSVGVAQGKYSIDTLREAGADLVIDSLEEKDQFFAFMDVTLEH